MGNIRPRAFLGAVQSGGYFRDVVRKIYPPTLRHPENGIFVLPEGPRYAEQAGLFWDALHNAGNFPQDRFWPSKS